MRVIAIANGFYGGCIREKGTEFTISPKYKLGKWMKPVEAEKKVNVPVEQAENVPSPANPPGLEGLSYADLYEQAKALGLTFEQKPSKAALLEAVEAKLKEGGEG